MYKQQFPKIEFNAENVIKNTGTKWNMDRYQHWNNINQKDILV